MNKAYRKFMRWGSLVKSTYSGNEYKTIEQMTEDTDTVLAVGVENWNRWELLKAWERNWERDAAFRERFDKDIDACVEERKSYEVILNVDYITPEDVIRFITPDYKTKFTVKNFGTVKVNGKIRRVFYLGQCHFGFLTEKNGEGDIFHICEFAELCERNGIDVQKIESVKV